MSWVMLPQHLAESVLMLQADHQLFDLLPYALTGIAEVA